MTSTTKTILAVGAVGIGGFLIYKIVAPKVANKAGGASKGPGIPAAVTSAGNFLGGAIASFFKGTPSPSGGNTVGTGNAGNAPGLSYPAPTYYTDTPTVYNSDGTVAPDGTFGPSDTSGAGPVWGDPNGDSGAGDGLASPTW